jgi:hypothetical protein
MRVHPRFVVLSLAIAFVLALLSGCGSSLPPRPLTAAQRSFLDQTPSLGVVAVTVPEPDYGHAATLRDMLQRTGLFERAELLDPAAPAPRYTATIVDRCSCRHGGWIPILPVLTLGVVPQFARCSVGYAFTLRETASGKEAQIACDIKETVGVGWLPALMNVLPGWTLSDTEKSPRFERRLAYSIASRLQRPEAAGSSSGQGSD